jgi:regulatory protein
VAAEQVDAVLDWLQANRYLSDERFAESRVHVRAARYGNLRIRQELTQHGVALGTEVAQQLKESEARRAQEVWARKFGQVPQDAAERARQMRFLAARGFSGEAIRHALQGASAEE